MASMSAAKRGRGNLESKIPPVFEGCYVYARLFRLYLNVQVAHVITAALNWMTFPDLTA